jgi:hypothetical protein
MAVASKTRSAPLDLSAFTATVTRGPLWANAEGQPSIWIRWTPAHETWVESEQPMAMGRLGTIGRIVRCGRYGTWFVGDWRPQCTTCQGTGQVEIGPFTGEPGDAGRETWIAALVNTLDAGLFYLLIGLVECPDCRLHPGWVVG